MSHIGSEEAVDIIRRTLDALLLTASDKGRPGSDLRRAAGTLKATASFHLQNNTIAQPLGECFELARLAGATYPEIDKIRRGLVAENPETLFATVVLQACVRFCLENQALIVADIEFTSRDDVERMQGDMRLAFAQANDVAADQMLGSTFLAMVELGGAVTFLLYERARPLPRMLRFEFAAPRPTLVFAYRLYDDAARADELRNENKVVHPAFMRRSGRALSA